MNINKIISNKFQGFRIYGSFKSDKFKNPYASKDKFYEGKPGHVEKLRELERYFKNENRPYLTLGFQNGTSFYYKIIGEF